jgi:hypothetical protein
MTKTEARKLAQQIFDEFDKQIVEATRGTTARGMFDELQRGSSLVSIHI